MQLLPALIPGVYLPHSAIDVPLSAPTGRTPLHLAINSPNPIEVVPMLVSVMDIDVNCTDGSMRTPLHWAAVCNQPSVCQALVSRGGNLQFRDMSGRTAMHYASEKVCAPL